MAICLVWISDSVSWAVVAAVWAMAAWRREASWRGAGWVTILIPLTTAMGVIGIDPTFFGGWMLPGGVALAAAGLLMVGRADGRRTPD